MYAIYGVIYHQYTPFMLALIYQHHGSYGCVRITLAAMHRSAEGNNTKQGCSVTG